MKITIKIDQETKAEIIRWAKKNGYTRSFAYQILFEYGVLHTIKNKKP